MRELVVEIVVGLGLVALGMLAVYVFIGDRAWDVNLDLAYLIGAVVFSVPAIVILEWRRRRNKLV